MFRTIYSLLLLLLLSVVAGYSVPRSLEPIEQITISEGLSNNRAMALLEDSRGYLWVGTIDGLNRYNGYNIESYKNGLYEQRISSNRITALYEDHHSNIWIGTEEGITIYDYGRDEFIIMEDYTDDNQPVASMEIVDICAVDGHILALTRNSGLLLYDGDYNLLRCDNISNSSCSDIEPLDGGYLLISANRQVLLYNVEEGSCERIKLPRSISTIGQMLYLDGEILLATMDGILRATVERQGGGYSFHFDERRYFQGHRLSLIYGDSHSGVWFSGSVEGLYYVENVADMASYSYVSDLSPRSIAEGAEGRIWVGKWFYGVDRYSINKNPFDFIDTRHIANFNLWHLDKFDDDHLLMRYSEGLYKLYNITTRRLSSSPVLESLGRQTYYLHPSEDGHHQAFIAGEEHIRLKQFVAGAWREVKYLDSAQRPTLPPLEVVEDDNGYMWLLYLNVVYRLKLDAAGYSLEQIPLDKHVGRSLRLRTLVWDKATNTVWIATSLQGIYRISDCNREQISGENITHFYYKKGQHGQLPVNNISSIVVDSTRLWIGTSSGLSRADVDGDSLRLRLYNISDGLPNNVIKAILPHGDNRLWITTDAGLTRMVIKREKFRNIDANSGVPPGQFNNSAIIFNDSTLLFGSTDGVVCVNTNMRMSPPAIPPIQFGDFQLFNTALRAGESYNGRVIYDKRIESGDRLELDYNQNFFSINAYAMSYSAGEGYGIRYRLLGANSEWIYRSSRDPMVSISALRPGDYRLEVSASNGNAVWGEASYIDISVAPPFWLSLWAYLIYIALVAAILYALMRVLLNIQALRHALHIESINKRDVDDRQRLFLNIAHEINTPLSLVLSASSTLYERYNHDEDIAGQLKMVGRQVRKISSMIDTVQSLELGENGLLVPRFNCFSFNEFITTIADDFSHLSEREGKQLIVDMPEVEIFVKADQSMLEKVLNNLLNNAFKYSLAGDAVAIRLRAVGSMLELEVQDSGIGISQVDLPHIFDRYYRAENRSIKGTGIGLAFTQQLVELHGGFISAESELGHGARFTITMPIITDDRPAIEAAAESMLIAQEELPSRDSSGAASSKIFLVEDDGQIRQYLTTFLSRYFVVHSFDDGAQCMEYMQEEWPDIIISDYMMPRMDGYELCRAVKSNINTSHIPFVLLTACTSLDYKIKCHEAGADSYITKPFYPQYLLTCIESTLRNYKNMRERFVVGAPLTMPSGVQSEQSEQNNEFMERLYALLDENLDREEIDFALFARELCVNRTLFFQKVKSLTGKTPYELIKEYRLIKAASLLANDGLSIEDVCIRVGFKSRTHFSKLFKDKFGMPPSKYV